MRSGRSVVAAGGQVRGAQGARTPGTAAPEESMLLWRSSLLSAPDANDTNTRMVHRCTLVELLEQKKKNIDRSSL